MEGRIRILFVCLGNICRSPMAEFVMKQLVEEAGWKDRVEIASAATSRCEVGNDIHRGSQAKMRQMGISFDHRRARALIREDYEKYDLLIGMDVENIWDMKRICGGDPNGKICLLLSFAGLERDIADPWYTGNFDDTYHDVLCGCRGLLKKLKQE